MSDPRLDLTDPRQSDPRLSDPVLRRDEPANTIWAWIAGVAVLALIAFVIVAGWNSHSNTASNSPPMTTGSTSHPVSPPATTGSGLTSPRPLTPAPAKPAAPKPGTQ